MGKFNRKLIEGHGRLANLKLFGYIFEGIRSTGFERNEPKYRRVAGTTAQL